MRIIQLKKIIFLFIFVEVFLYISRIFFWIKTDNVWQAFKEFSMHKKQIFKTYPKNGIKTVNGRKDKPIKIKATKTGKNKKIGKTKKTGKTKNWKKY